jgi:hypothetical protein
MIVLGHGNVEKAELFPHSHNPYYYYLRIKIPIKLPLEGGREAQAPPIPL